MSNIIRLLIIIFTVCSASIAHADIFEEALKFNCYPELGYAELENTSFHGSQDFLKKEPDTIYKKYGIYPYSKMLEYNKKGMLTSIKSLKEKCRINNTDYVFEITMHVGNSNVEGRCGLHRTLKVKIKVGEKEILKDFVFGYCNDGDRIINQLRLCDYGRYKYIMTIGEGGDFIEF